MSFAAARLPVPDVRARRWLDVDGDGNIDIKELRIAYEVMPAEMAEVSQGTHSAPCQRCLVRRRNASCEHSMRTRPNR